MTLQTCSVKTTFLEKTATDQIPMVYATISLLNRLFSIPLRSYLISVFSH